MTSSPQTDSPFAINFRRLQRYNKHMFSLEQIVLFEYLLVLWQNFGFQPFYHSSDKIFQDTGIKRSKLEQSIEYFASIGLLTVEVKGFPKVKHFTMEIDNILSLIPEIYQFVENSKLNAENNKLYVEISNQFVEIYKQEKHKEKHIKETQKETHELKRNDIGNRRKFSLAEAKVYMNSLQKQFNSRRQYKSKQTGKMYPEATLGYKTDKMAETVLEALNTIDKDAINDAWMVLIDSVLEGTIKPVKLLPYFFSKKDSEFDVIHSLADYHNLNYIIPAKSNN